MAATTSAPPPIFLSYAVAWIAFNGSADTWSAFQAWCEAEQICEAPRGPALSRAVHRFVGSFFLCDHPRIRAWWSEHGGDEVRDCVSLAEPYAAYSDHPAYTEPAQADVTSLEYARSALDASGVEGLLGVGWRARLDALATDSHERMSNALRAGADLHRATEELINAEELGFTLANERGDGPPPSPGWTWVEAGPLRTRGGSILGYTAGWANSDDLVVPVGQGRGAKWACNSPGEDEIVSTWARETMITVDVKRGRRPA